MRAVYQKDLSTFCGKIIDRNTINHFTKVLRIKEKVEILFLDGMGGSQVYRVELIEKKSIKLIPTTEYKVSQKAFDVSIVICSVKKDAMEQIIKQATEIGLNKIYICESKYSQKTELNDERALRIMVSAMEQSNNPYLPETIHIESFEKLPYSQLGQLIYFTSNPDLSNKKLEAINGNCSYIIGPEGGLSTEEEEMFMAMDNLSLVHLNMPIMRAETAVTVCFGKLHDYIAI